MKWQKINDDYKKCHNYEMVRNVVSDKEVFTLYFQGSKLGRYDSHKDALLAAQQHDTNQYRDWEKIGRAHV